MCSEFKLILWERFRGSFGWSFRLLTWNKSNRVALGNVRRAYGKRIWSACYFYTYEPHFLKSGTKSLISFRKIWTWTRWLFCFFVKTWLCFYTEANIKKSGRWISFKLGGPIVKLLFSKTSQSQGNWNNVRWSKIDIKSLKFCFHIFGAC